MRIRNQWESEEGIAAIFNKIISICRLIYIYKDNRYILI
jgi:hypothetical protein